MVWDALLQGLTVTFSLPALGGIALGVFLGILFGAVPGLTATLGIALMLPFIWALTPVTAFAILLSLVASVPCLLGCAYSHAGISAILPLSSVLSS